MIVRIAGVTIPSEKKVKISLTYIFGVGETSASSVLKEVGVSGEKRSSRERTVCKSLGFF